MHIHLHTWRIITTQWINRRAITSLRNIPHTLLQGFKKGYSRFFFERELETEQNCNILTPTLMAISVVSFSTPGLATSTTSCHQQVSKLTGDLEGPFGRVWLSLPHLLSNSYFPQLSDFLSWPSDIIVHRPLNRPLNLWNDMFDRHQVKITVMQFRGNSLLSVPWDFLPCPISSAKPAYAISSHNCQRNVSLPSGASLWNSMIGRVEGQYTTTFPLKRLIIIRKFDS